MKNLIITLLLIVIIFTSCDMAVLDDFWYLEKSYNIKSMNDVIRYVKDVNYKSDNERYGKQYYQTPHETEVKKNGNCVDRSILGLALAYKYLGKKGKYYNVDTTGNGIVDHGMYSVNEKMYNHVEGSYKIIETYSFDEVPYLASSKR